MLTSHLPTVLASLPQVTPSAPPGADKFLTVVGWIFWGLGLSFLVAAAGGLAALAWARWHGGRSFLAASHLGTVAACAAAFSVIGQLMAPLVS